MVVVLWRSVYSMFESRFLDLTVDLVIWSVSIALLLSVKALLIAMTHWSPVKSDVNFDE